MSTRKSLVNNYLFKNLLKNNLFPAKVSLFIFLGCFILTTIASESSFMNIVTLGVFGISAIVLVLSYACLLNSSLINKTKATMIKTLPLSTFSLWFTTYLTGFVIITLTLLIEGIGIIAVDIFSTLVNISGGISIFRFILMIFALTFIYYTIAFFVASVTGNRLGQILFTVVVWSLPVVLIMSITLISDFFVPLISYQIDIQYLEALVALVAGLNYIEGGNVIIFMHVLLALVLFVGSYFGYKKRHDELIGEALVYRGVQTGFKIVFVYIVTMLVFFLVIELSYIEIRYDTRCLLMLTLIYLAIGAITTIIVELVFKNNHVYRNLMIYLPILLGVFGLHYYVFNQECKNVFNQQAFNETTINSTRTGNSISLSNKDTRDLMAYLDDHREYILRGTGDGNSDILILHLNERGDTLFLDKQAIVGFFKQYQDNEHHQDILNKLGTIQESTLAYLKCFYDDKVLYFAPDDISKLITLVKKEPITAEVAFGQETINIYDDQGEIYLLKLTDEIKHLFESEAVNKLSKFVDACELYITDTSRYKLTNDNLIYQYLKTIVADIDSIDNYHEIKLIGFEQEHVVYHMQLIINSTRASTQVELEVKLKDDNGKIVIDGIEGKVVD